MATVTGWYRKRVGHSRRVCQFSPAWQSTGVESMITLRTTYGDDDDGNRQHLQISFSYDEARQIITAWQRYIAEHPDKATP